MSLTPCRNFLDAFDAVGAVAVDGENVVGDINQEGCPDWTASAIETKPHAGWSASSRHAFPPVLRWRWREPRSSRRPDVARSQAGEPARAFERSPSAWAALTQERAPDYLLHRRITLVARACPTAVQPAQSLYGMTRSHST